MNEASQKDWLALAELLSQVVGVTLVRLFIPLLEGISQWTTTQTYPRDQRYL